MTVKKKVKKVKMKVPDVVVVGRQEGKLSDIFDLSEKEWSVIANECAQAEKKAENVQQLAAGFSVVNGGTMALRGYFFGCAVSEMRTRKAMVDVAQELVEHLRGKGD